MITHSFYFKPRSAFHFGVRGVGLEATLEYAPSDTLFSAFCITWRLLQGNQSLRDEIFAPFGNNAPPFLNTGGFPYVETAEGTVRFYPAPTSLRLVDISEWSEAERKIAKAQWLSERLFLAWVNGDSASKFVEDASPVQAGVYVTQAEKAAIQQRYQDKSLWMVGDVPHVAIDRVQNAANIFQVGRLWFVEGGGLWSAFHLPTASNLTINQVTTTLAVLGDIGLGGERSSGHGLYDLGGPTPMPELDAAIQAVAANEFFTTLSHYYPNGADEAHQTLGDYSAYELTTRRGWMSNPDSHALRHKTVKMIHMGGVLHTIPNQSSYGRLVDVTPEVFKAQINDDGYVIWRYGYALPIAHRRSPRFAVEEA